MSLQWNLIFVSLCIEIVIVLALIFPLMSPRKWQNLFNSRIGQSIKKQIGKYFNVLLIILVLIVLHALRDIRKFHNLEPSNENISAKFKVERNFYLSGFTLFLVLVIRRLIVLISTQATIEAQSEASYRQAQSATIAARNFMKTDIPDNKKIVEELENKIKSLEDDVEKERKDKLAMKNQAENLSKEYDRLTEEYSKMQKEIAAESTDKKKEK